MIVLLIILILFVLLCITPVGAHVIYSAEGPKVSVKAGPLSILIFPRPKKEKTEKQLAREEKKAREKAAKKAEKAEEKKRLKEEKKKAKAAAKNKAKAKNTLEASGTKQEAKTQEKGKGKADEKPKQTLGGKIEFFKELLGIGLSALGCIKRKLILKDLVLYLTVGGKGDDAAKAALLYGRAWAAVGALTPVLENTFDIKNRDIQVNIDFFTEENVIYAEACILFRIGDILWIALNHGVRALILFLKQKRKGRKNHGTSHQ